LEGGGGYRYKKCKIEGNWYMSSTRSRLGKHFLSDWSFVT